MPAHRYVEEIGLAAMLAAKRLADVTPEVNLREHVTPMPPPSVNQAAYSGFETQRRHTRSPKQEYQWPHKRCNICGCLAITEFSGNIKGSTLYGKWHSHILMSQCQGQSLTAHMQTIEGSLYWGHLQCDLLVILNLYFI